MDRHEVAMLLQARKGQRARIRLSDDVAQVVVIESDDEEGFLPQRRNPGKLVESYWLAKSQDQGCFDAFSQGNASRAAVAIKITAGSCRVCGWL